MSKPKIVVVLGPTASGKSDLAVTLAQKFNGEVISADSRQVYKGLNLGTGKINRKEMQGIPHHLLSIMPPQSQFSVEQFKKTAQEAISKIIKKNKVPIICGGTGFYIQALVDNITFPEVKPNVLLREELAKKLPEELFGMLLKLDHDRASTIDPTNKQRVIRAIEIAEALGKIPPVKSEPLYDPLLIGLETDDELLRQKINTRLTERIKKGMIREAEKLHQEGLTWKRMDELGLEYRYLARFLQHKLLKEEMLERLQFEIWHYAKRQKTWFKRDERIRWFPISEKASIETEVKKFLA
jgi:tRNA dimethylallyltransferase